MVTAINAKTGGVVGLSLFDTPRARTSDPHTAHEAAARIAPGTSLLVQTIRQVVYLAGTPMSQFDIAHAVGRAQPGRWSDATIRTACARAALHAVDSEGRSPRGMRVLRYVVGSKP